MIQYSPEEFYLFKNQSSVGPWDGPQYHIAPMWAFYLQTIFMGLVFVAGTPLNAIVLIVTIKYKKLRQPLNYILVNISVSGLMCCVFCIFTVFVASSQGYFVFGKHMCAFEGFAGATGGLVTGWSLAFLAFERYIVICKPFGNFRFNSRHALLVVAATWIIGVGVAIPPFFGWSRWDTGQGGRWGVVGSCGVPGECLRHLKCHGALGGMGSARSCGKVIAAERSWSQSVSRILPVLRQDTSMWEQQERRLHGAPGLLQLCNWLCWGLGTPTPCQAAGELLLQLITGLCPCRALSSRLFLVNAHASPCPTPAGPKCHPRPLKQCSALPRTSLPLPGWIHTGRLTQKPMAKGALGGAAQPRGVIGPSLATSTANPDPP
uniref:Opsin 1, short wave sensitive n=54 Tax=Passeriformes TaxID=9126 RepID=A0A8C5JG72_JUNHY